MVTNVGVSIIGNLTDGVTLLEQPYFDGIHVTGQTKITYDRVKVKFKVTGYLLEFSMPYIAIKLMSGERQNFQSPKPRPFQALLFSAHYKFYQKSVTPMLCISDL